MGRKSRQKRMRRMLRPGPAKAPTDTGRSARRSSAKAKVMKLLEAMVDAANEDLASGAEKPRVSYGQALRAGELLVRYAEEEAEEEVAEEAAEEQPGTQPFGSVDEELNRIDEVLRKFEQRGKEDAAPAAQTG